MTLFAILVFAVGFGIFGILFPWICYKRINKRWLHPKRIFIFIFLLGIATGFGSSFLTYTASETLKVAGAPLPLALFHLEEGNWYDFVFPSVTSFLIIALNCLIVSSLLLIFITMFSFLPLKAEQGAAANP
jgi:predicted transporter